MVAAYDFQIPDWENVPLEEKNRRQVWCARDPWYFSNYCLTQDRHTYRVPVTRPFPRYEYIKEWFDLYHSEFLSLEKCNSQVLKSRQMFWTWAAACYGLWETMFHGNVLDVFISRSEEAAKEIKQRAQFMYDNLPSYLQVTTSGRKSSTKIEFPTIGSVLKFMPAGPDSLRTFSAFRVFGDEMAFWSPYEKEIYEAARPMTRHMDVASTMQPNTLFQKFWENPKNSSTKVATFYWRHPDKQTEDYKERTMEILNLDEEGWQREMEGKPIAGEGLVYKLFSMGTHVISINDLPRDGNGKLAFDEMALGVDVGYTNPSCLTLYGFDHDGRLYALEEFYKTKQSEQELVAAAKDLMTRWGIYEAPDEDDPELHIKRAEIEANADFFRYQDEIPVYGDHDPKTQDTFLESGLNYEYGDKDISAGIRHMNQRMKVQKDGKPRYFIIGDLCPNNVKEKHSYHYPKVRQGKARSEKPVKDKDHAQDQERYVAMTHSGPSVAEWI